MIENKIILILGQRGTGKTMFASLYSLFYTKIYSNYELYTPGANNIIYTNISDILSLRFTKEKKLIIFDEGGINLNSRQAMQEYNIEIGKMLFISRKINADFVFITQYKFTIDKYIRYSADFNVIMNRNGSIFNADLYKVAEQTENGIYIKTLQFTFADYIKSGVKYNTLERSILQKG